MKNVRIALFAAVAVATGLARVSSACSVSITDCNGGTLSDTWTCPTCPANGPSEIKGRCQVTYVYKDNDPNNCVVSLQGACATCYYAP